MNCLGCILPIFAHGKPKTSWLCNCHRKKYCHSLACINLDGDLTLHCDWVHWLLKHYFFQSGVGFFASLQFQPGPIQNTTELSRILLWRVSVSVHSHFLGKSFSFRLYSWWYVLPSKSIVLWGSRSDQDIRIILKPHYFRKCKNKCETSSPL